LLLDELTSRLTAMPEADRKEITRIALEATKKFKFTPNPGPQTEAYLSSADELFYGGAAGGGKSFLLSMLGIYAQERSLLFRREYPQIRGLIDEVANILGTRDGYNSQDKLWKLPDGRIIEFGSVQHEDDKEKYQGRAHDFKGFDEITHFTESQYRFLIAWNRSSKPGQRCRVVATGNPPHTAEGAWVIKYWAPWLDPNHPNPAKPGELRWFTTIDGKDVEVDGRGPHQIDGREVYAQSRSFIAARLEDNPQLMEQGYAARLEATPEPFRTMMREGRFDVAMKDADFQVIPTSWIMAAQNRWTAQQPVGAAMTAIGLDLAGGGADETILAPRFGGWYGPLVAGGEVDASKPSDVAGFVVKHRRDRCPVVVDMGGGWGGGVKERLEENNVDIAPFNGANSSSAKTKDGQLGFINKRAEAYWKFREELDPEQDGGSAICLPPDAQLRSDLASATWKLTPRGIQIESKIEIRKRLGRSPDRADAVVMALAPGTQKQMQMRRTHSAPPRVVMGHSAARRRSQ
jgi:hypothetical protein